MSKKRSEISRNEEPPEIDDLKLIIGIGPVVERRLHGVGIYTYAQLAALSPADIAAAAIGISGLTSERIIKQDWVGQARKLASGSISSEAQEEVEVPAELVVSSNVSQVELAAPAAEKAECGPPVVAEPELTILALEITEPAPSVAAPPDAKEVPILPPAVAMTGKPHLRQIEMVSADTHTPQDSFVQKQPFNVRLTLDLRDVKVLNDTQFGYRASIYSKSLEGHPRQLVGETIGIVASTGRVTVSVEGIALPKGSYRLKAIVILNQMTTEPAPQAGLLASKESNLLLIF